MPLRCLLVDDNDAFLETARTLLERQGVQVAGVASNIAGALRQARALRPDVVLVDIGLGEERGFELARLLAADGQDGQDGQRVRADVILISAQAERYYIDLIAESPAADSCTSRSYRHSGSGSSSATPPDERSGD